MPQPDNHFIVFIFIIISYNYKHFFITIAEYCEYNIIIIYYLTLNHL